MSNDGTLNAIKSYMEQERLSDAARECLTFLKKHPTDIEANMLYGQIAMAMNRNDDAVIIFRKLLAVDPQNAEVHDRLAFLYNSLADHLNAKRHAIAALKLDNSLLHSQLVLGSVAALEGHSEDSLKIFDIIRRKTPDTLHVEKTYVEALQQCGEFDKARQLLLSLIDRFPQDPFLYLALSRSGRYTEESPEAELICSLARENGDLVHEYADTNDRVCAYIALHRIESALKHHSKAFSFLSKAKAIRASEQPYEHSNTVEVNAKYRDSFSKDFFSENAARGHNSDAPIFIVGMPRSGSTLMERVLAAHPDIAPGGEQRLIGNLQQEACAHFGSNQHDVAALVKMPDDAWQRLGEEYLKRARQRVGETRFFTDKMPGNFMVVGFIRAILPQARIIHLSRHPVANCLSVFETDFQEGHAFANDLSNLGAFYVEYLKTMNYWRELLGDSLIEVQYEALVSDTEGTTSWLGQQLGIKLDASSSNIRNSQQQGSIQTASLWQARQPIHTASIDRWEHLREQLTPLIDALRPGWQED